MKINYREDNDSGQYKVRILRINKEYGKLLHVVKPVAFPGSQWIGTKLGARYNVSVLTRRYVGVVSAACAVATTY
jgi:hypothetical protein